MGDVNSTNCAKIHNILPRIHKSYVYGWTGGVVVHNEFKSRLNVRETAFAIREEFSVGTPDKRRLQISAEYGVGSVEWRDPRSLCIAKTPDLLCKLSLMRRVRHVLQLLAELHAGLGCSKTRIPSSTNGGW